MGTDTVNEYHYQDMEWVSCDKCGELQLKTLIDERVLYGKTHNGSVGKSWVEHNNTFVDFIASECYGNVLEIGGGNLHIANKIAESDKVNNYHIIDSNIFKENATTYKFTFSEDLFDLNQIPDKSYDFIIHSHTLEHLYEPVLELKQLNRVLKSNGKMFFSVPLINNMLNQGYTNALNFEHTFYLNEDLMRTLLVNNLQRFYQNIKIQ
jgi:SAM-dependent methyltransferase